MIIGAGCWYFIYDTESLLKKFLIKLGELLACGLPPATDVAD